MKKKKKKRNPVLTKFSSPEAQKYYEQSSEDFVNRINELTPTELQKFDKHYDLLEEVIKAYGEAKGMGDMNLDHETGEVTFEDAEPSGKKLAELDKNPEARRLIDILFDQSPSKKREILDR